MGDDEKDEVDSRFFNSNCRPNCNTCYCSDSNCRSKCDKCYGQSSNGGFGNTNNSPGNYVNCNSCYCSSSSLCYSQCSKCQNNGFSNNNNGGSGVIAGSGTANCNSCNCAYSNCKSQCFKCNINYDGWRKAPESTGANNNNNAGDGGVIA